MRREHNPRRPDQEPKNEKASWNLHRPGDDSDAFCTHNLPRHLHIVLSNMARQLLLRRDFFSTMRAENWLALSDLLQSAIVPPLCKNRLTAMRACRVTNHQTGRHKANPKCKNKQHLISLVNPVPAFCSQQFLAQQQQQNQLPA